MSVLKKFDMLCFNDNLAQNRLQLFETSVELFFLEVFGLIFKLLEILEVFHFY